MRHRLAAALAMLVVFGVVVPAQTVLDKVLSNVNGEVITQLDVRQARMLKLRLVTATAESDVDLLRGLENRRLVLSEVNHVTLPAPAAGDLAARRRDWESTVGAGAELSAAARSRRPQRKRPAILAARRRPHPALSGAALRRESRRGIARRKSRAGWRRCANTPGLPKGLAINLEL